MEIEALRLMARVGLFEHPVEPVRPVGGIVQPTGIALDQWIERTNNRYIEELGRQRREERRPVNPEAHR